MYDFEKPPWSNLDNEQSLFFPRPSSVTRNDHALDGPLFVAFAFDARACVRFPHRAKLFIELRHPFLLYKRAPTSRKERVERSGRGGGRGYSGFRGLRLSILGFFEKDNLAWAPESSK